ncbi:hypothetical protein [Pseudorhodobacter aquimaris]|uniref:hypothetical protein n=1 Tax=Pseudorhodobacter aquimaris TaxID=687412 RepID=UPI00067B0917|nr:hypothetical protein [Pseudorhodobacter aquimaris]
MSEQKKKMGRPPTDTEPVMVRMSPAMITAIDEYRRTQGDLPTRPEMVRRVMAEFLERETSFKP